MKIEIIKCLLNAGADINKQDSNGQTPLHMAVDIAIDGTIQQGGKMGEEPINVIEYLLIHSAKTNIADKKGKTPLDWAKDYRSKKIVGLLEQHQI